jgi:hypothetical protein
LCFAWRPKGKLLWFLQKYHQVLSAIILNIKNCSQSLVKLAAQFKYNF